MWYPYWAVPPVAHGLRSNETVIIRVESISLPGGKDDIKTALYAAVYWECFAFFNKLVHSQPCIVHDMKTIGDFLKE